MATRSHVFVSIIPPSVEEDTELSLKRLKELERREALFNAEVARREAAMEASQKSATEMAVPRRDAEEVEQKLHDQRVLVGWLESQLEAAWKRQEELEKELRSA